MKNKFLSLFLVSVFAIATLFGVGHSAWAINNVPEAAETVQVNIPTWTFDRDSDAAVIEKVSNCAFLTASKETSILSPAGGSVEAVRLTNTAGTQTKAHSFDLTFDTRYNLGDIRFQKVEFDYYHAQKRQQAGKGYPKLQLMDGSTKRGSQQGGGETMNAKSPFIATSLDANWWHLEYYITALAPTMADYQDTPVSLTTKISGIRIIDDTIYDHDSITGFAVVDNVRISSAPCSRLGMFNRTSSFAAGTYYWFKIAWAGELHSVSMAFSDDTIAEHAPTSKSPFYVKGLQAGQVTVTATVEVDDEHHVYTISTTITVT